MHRVKTGKPSMLDYLRHRWFLLSLVSILLLGMAWPRTLEPVVAWLSGDAIVASVTFIMALALEPKSLWSALRRPAATWLAVLLNSGLAPPLGWLASRPLPIELAQGVIVASVAPCTLASAAVWTRRAGGNDAVAFLVTMITNLTCFVVVPLWLKLLVGVDADIDYASIILGLVVLVVAPIVVGQLLRLSRPIGDWATRRKHLLSSLAQAGILAMVLIGAVSCGLKLEAISGDSLLSTRNIVLMLLAVLAVHVALLAIGFLAGRLLRISRGDTIAVAFAGSQKTLMVGAFLATAVGPLAILPMVAYHAVQLFVDTLVADWLQDRPPSPEPLEEELL